MSWAPRLKRVFQLDISHCEHCGGTVKIITGIEEPLVIQKIIEHLEQQARGPPVRLPATQLQ